MRTTKIINFSAPPALAKQIAKQAKKENRTKSELLRRAFEYYVFKKQLEEIQEYGAELAEKLGLETYDDIENFIEGN